MNNEYYVYVYLDPRKEGQFKYGEYGFDYEPFYVGKGKGDRFIEHLRESRLSKSTNNIKVNKISELKVLDMEPIIVKLFETIDEYDALELEKNLISIIGRLDLESGPLSNLTNGGDGIVGRVITDNFRNKQSTIMKDYYKDNPISEEVRDKISKALLSKNMVRSEETKRKISEANSGREYSDEYIEHIKKIRKGPKLTHRNRYEIISPKGEIFNILGKVELDKFIKNNNLSSRKLLEFVNKGVITENDVRKVINGTNNKTKNSIGWEIKKK